MSAETCPVGGCSYTGPAESVEAHISGSTSGDHEGVLGQDLLGDGYSSDSYSWDTYSWLLVVALVISVALLVLTAGSGKTQEKTQEEPDEGQATESVIEG